MEKNQNQMVASMQPTSSVATFNFFDPTQFETMQRVCKLFAYSELVPDIYKVVSKPLPNNATEDQIKAIQAENKMAETKAIANCMIAISMAMRINADPLMVMQNMIIIYGRPSWSSKFLIATVNTCGRFEPLQYKFTNNGKVGKIKYTDYQWNDRSRRKEAVIKEFDGSQIENLSCFAYTTKKGSNDVLKSSTIDLRLAIVEGWYTKNGSKWQTMPNQMLMYRAASMWTSVYAPEISMGMKTVEEQQDIIDAEFIEVKDVDQRVQEAKKDANTGVIDMDAAPADEQPQPEAKPAEDPKPETDQKKADPQPADGPNW